MALRVWLPLLGNVNQQGASEVIATVSGASVNTAGKIGSCYSFDGSDDFISLSGTTLYNIFKGGSQQFSICFWVYHNDATRAIIFGDYGLSGTIGFNVELTASHGVRFYWNGSPDKNFNSTSYVTAQGWTHIVITYNGSILNIYRNGILSTDSWSGTLATKNKTAGHFYLGRDSRTGTTALNGRLNDVRIYDHCLSAAEVREISQGLVLHYKLDDIYSMATTNQLGSKSEHFSGWGSYGFGAHGQTTIANIAPALSGEAGMVINKDSGNYDGEIATGVSGYNLNKNESITFSAYVKGNGNTIGKTGYIWIYKSNGTNTISTGTSFTFTSEWQRVKHTITWTYDNPGTTSTSCYVRCNRAQNESFYISNCQLESGTMATGFTNTSRKVGTIQDSSGYNHNGIINGNIIISSDTSKYNYSAQFDGVDDSITVPYNAICPENIFTLNLWFKKDALGSKSYETLFGGPSGFEMDTRSGAATSLSLYMASVRSGNRNSVTSLSLGNWYMVTMTRDGTKEKYYINGIFQSEIDAKAMPSGTYRIGAWSSNTGQNFYGLINDFRIYCTALDADAIRQLYEVGAKIDNKGNLHTFELNEQASNIMFNIEKARTNLTFTDGLGKYTQNNCQVTLTEDGYHIYRPPNLTTSANGNTMYGGLKLVNQSTDTVSPYNATRDNIWGLQQNHTYLFAFHVKGQSSNAVGSFGWTNNMGWGVGGVGPTPTLVAKGSLPSNFNSEMDCYYIFTISDAIVKTSNDARGGYDGSSDYLSYRHITFNWNYTNTGTLGTDLYLTNFRLYDVTNHMAEFTKIGQAKFYSFVEQMNKCQIRKNSELLSTEFIEL